MRKEQEIVYNVTSHLPTPENIKIHNKMYEVVKKYNPSSVLEIGSGFGVLGHMLYSAGINYVGIEPDKEQIRLCRENFPNLQVFEASCYDDLEHLNLGKFDMVISSDVIEHLYLPKKLVGFAKKYVKDGGKVITCTPNFGSYFKNLLYSILNKWDKIHGVMWDGGHIKFFSKASLKEIFCEQGFNNFEWYYVRNVNYPIFKMSIICVCNL